MPRQDAGQGQREDCFIKYLAYFCSSLLAGWLAFFRSFSLAVSMAAFMRGGGMLTRRRDLRLHLFLFSSLFAKISSLFWFASAAFCFALLYRTLSRIALFLHADLAVFYLALACEYASDSTLAKLQ